MGLVFTPIIALKTGTKKKSSFLFVGKKKIYTFAVY